MRLRSLALIALFASVASSVQAQATLYDGANNTTPDQAPWNWGYAQSPASPDVRGIASNGATVFDTTADSALQAGYARLAPAPLDNVAGYEVTFDLQVFSETHGNANRSGCDVIVLGNDHKGVELAFWTNEVWAQSDIFTHSTGSESHTFDTTSGRTHYTLRVANNAYSLMADTTTLLNGNLHSYPALPGTPYGTANFLFIGDDSTSSNARFSLARVTSSVPEPGLTFSFALLIGTGATRLLTRRSRSIASR